MSSINIEKMRKESMISAFFFSFQLSKLKQETSVPEGKQFALHYSWQNDESKFGKSLTPLASSSLSTIDCPLKYQQRSSVLAFLALVRSTMFSQET